MKRKNLFIRLKDSLMAIKSIRRIFYFFPFQLLFAHLKKNHFLILFWIIVYALITKQAAMKYGIPYLFISPEYLHETSFWSYLIFGFAYGGFVTAFNISSYIMNGHRFPFIATLSRPFFKYSVNNGTLPLLGIILYIYNVINYHTTNAYSTNLDITEYIFGFLLGFVAFILMSIGYFFKTNKDIKKLFNVDTAYDNNGKPKKKTIKTVLHKKYRWSEFLNLEREWTIETYLSNPFEIRLARNIDHYDKSMLRKVLKQNHLNAALFETVVFISLISLSFLGDFEIFAIPAGASLLLMFTMAVMIFSAIHSWFKGWSSTVIIAGFILINYFSTTPWFNRPNQAYGLEYNEAKAEFSHESMEYYVNEEIFYHDFKHGVEILDNWRKKNIQNSMVRGQKPKIVFINTTGGGIRATLFTFHILQQVDSILNGELLNHTMLMTGSSGGMVGASYIRELYYQKQIGEIPSIYSRKYVENISRDFLNPIAFNLAVNDIFKLRKFNIGYKEYPKDRAYAFEQQIKQNTQNLLDRKLKDYAQLEYSGMIPMMILSPTVVQDGRQLIISPQPVSYLSKALVEDNMNTKPIIDGIEFRRFFKDQDADQLEFTSALRMSSTFPYIMPMVSLPSTPRLDVMDSGLRDNFGLKTSLKFLYTFRNWIASNTSGVIIIQIRDKEKEIEIKPEEKMSITKSLTTPVGNIYNNIFNIQDFNQDLLLQFTSSWFDGQIDIVDLSLENTSTKKVSLNWHLTPKEKSQILNSIELQSNQTEIERLQTLLAK